MGLTVFWLLGSKNTIYELFPAEVMYITLDCFKDKQKWGHDKIN